METLYISKSSEILYADPQLTKKKKHLLWGDTVYVINKNTGLTGIYQVKSRGTEGYLNSSSLQAESLLEVYFIDVGQGDGVLIKTPDSKHILVDGGYNRKKQQSGKNAADFIDWKFKKEYGRNDIRLDAMISSHNDADHYGGLWDLLNPNEQKELDIPTSNITVGKLYHAGVAWLESPAGTRGLGPKKNGKLTLIVDSDNDIDNLLNQGIGGYKLQGEWKQFMKCVRDKGIPTERLSNISGSLTGFDIPSKKFSIKTLSPIELSEGGKPAYKSLGSSPSQNTNGHSITLRVNYGKVRIMLTGDLNSKSQKLILDYYQQTDDLRELSCDVAKSCHHGSDDCSFEFLSKLNAGCTVISSGDAEGHSHPRPNIVSASSITGHLEVRNDEVVTPLVYSTEIARSYKIGKPTELKVVNANQKFRPADSVMVSYEEVNAGDLNPKKRTGIDFWDKMIVGGIIYGLVNVRTDGEKILCATMSETDGSWDIKEFKSRFL